MSPDVDLALPSGLGQVGFWTAVAAFAGIIGLGIGLERVQPDPLPVAVVTVASVAALAAAVFLIQRRKPLLGHAVVAAAGIGVIGADRSANPVWFAVLLVIGWCAVIGGRRLALPLWVAVMVWFTVEWAIISPDPGWGAWLAGNTLILAAGLLIRNQLTLVAQLRAAQAGLAAKAQAEERNRLSRDLHDIIAHTLTVSLLHVMSARLAVEHDPAAAADALAEAERLGRESLTEVRQVVGMLRDDPSTGNGRAGSDGEGGSNAPLPGLAALPALVERFRAAGMDIGWSVNGDTTRLPATVGLAVYRIAQEALTNVIKHAPGAPATARLTVSAREAALAVDSLGPPGSGTGLGLLNMRERAESVGGSCQAGPNGAGWTVLATFPLAAQEGTS